jgi:WD40 repeat protein
VALRQGKPVTFAAFSPDGGRVVTVGADRTAHVWRAATGASVIGPLRHGTPLLFAGFSRDGQRLVTCGGEGGEGGEVHVWELSGAKAGRSVSFNTGMVSHAAFLTPDGKHVLGVGGRRIARLWQLPSGKPLGSVTGVRLDGEGSVSPDVGRVLKLDGPSARVCDITTGQPAGPPLLHGGEVIFAAFSPDGRSVVTGARDRTARVWDAASGQPLAPPLQHGRAVYWARFSDDARLLLTAAEDGSVRAWELAPREMAQRLPPPQEAGPSALSPDGRLTASVDGEGAVRVRDAVSGRAVAGPWKLTGPVTHLAFAPDGRRVLTAGAATAGVWDAADGGAVTPPLTHAGGVQQVGFTPDGSRAVVRGAKDRLQVWDAATGAVQSSQALPGRAAWRWVALTPDGRAAAVIRAGDLVEVRDVHSGEVRAGPFRHAAKVSHAAFSPDGTRLAVAASDGSAFLWDVGGGRPAAPPLQHGAPLRQVAFSGDGRRLVTVAEDHTARAWDASTGLPVSPLLSHAEPVVYASLSADGRRLATRGPNGAGHAWDLAPDERPVEDLIQLTQILAGQALDATSGGFEPVAMTDLRQVWPKMRARYPQEFRPSVP